MNEKRKTAGKEKFKKRMFYLNSDKEESKIRFHKGSDRIREESSYVKPCGEFEFERELRKRR